jgi:hypothetical protein
MVMMLIVTKRLAAEKKLPGVRANEYPGNKGKKSTKYERAAFLTEIIS